jgi:hypothetical protein
MVVVMVSSGVVAMVLVVDIMAEVVTSAEMAMVDTMATVAMEVIEVADGGVPAGTVGDGIGGTRTTGGIDGGIRISLSRHLL